MNYILEILKFAWSHITYYYCVDIMKRQYSKVNIVFFTFLKDRSEQNIHLKNSGCGLGWSSWFSNYWAISVTLLHVIDSSCSKFGPLHFRSIEISFKFRTFLEGMKFMFLLQRKMRNHLSHRSFFLKVE